MTESESVRLQFYGLAFFFGVVLPILVWISMWAFKTTIRWFRLK